MPSLTRGALVILSALCLAAKKPSVKQRRPAADIRSMVVILAQGEKTTRFQISREANQSVLRVANTSGFDKSRPVSNVDMNFIADEFRKLPVVARVPETCYRSRVDISI